MRFGFRFSPTISKRCIYRIHSEKLRSVIEIISGLYKGGRGIVSGKEFVKIDKWKNKTGNPEGAIQAKPNGIQPVLILSQLCFKTSIKMDRKVCFQPPLKGYGPGSSPEIRDRRSRWIW